MDNKTIFRLARFKPDPFGHGGYKRCAQIDEILKDEGFGIVDLDDAIRFQRGFRDKLKFRWKSLKLLLRKGRFRFSRQTWREINYLDLWWYHLYSQKKKDKTKEGQWILWEYTWPKYWFIPEVAHDLKFKIVALPHNLESFVIDQFSHQNPLVESPDWHSEELNYLKECDYVFCISREEEWLLSILLDKDKIHHLPYYPPKPVEEFLLNIREERSITPKKKKIIILGTGGNPPTREGIKTLLLELYQNVTLIHGEIEFIGFDLDQLEKFKIEQDIDDRIKISNNVTKEYLKNSLVESICLLIYQVPSSGALTRIQEMRVAGVPIIVNSWAARNYFNIEGVHVYQTPEEMIDFLKGDGNLSNPKLPKRPRSFENRLKQLLLTNRI